MQWQFQYIASIIIGTPGAAGYTPINTGSGIIVRLPDDLVLITACHVLEHYEANKRDDPNVSLQVGGLNLPIDTRRIWRDSQDDLAVLAISEGEAARIGTSIHEPVAWPPPIPQHNEYVTITGLPVMRRSRPDSNTVLFGPMLAHLPVLGSYLNHFTCRVERDYIKSLLNRPLPTTDIDYGGMSGGPVFLDSSLHFPLVGIVKEVNHDLEHFVIQGFSNIPARIR